MPRILPGTSNNPISARHNNGNAAVPGYAPCSGADGRKTCAEDQQVLLMKAKWISRSSGYRELRVVRFEITGDSKGNIDAGQPRQFLWRKLEIALFVIANIDSQQEVFGPTLLHGFHVQFKCT